MSWSRASCTRWPCLEEDTVIVAANICAILDSHVQLTGLGCVFATGTGFTLQRNPDTVRAPDAAFVAKDRMPPGEAPDGYLALAPDLAVEVISPMTGRETYGKR